MGYANPMIRRGADWFAAAARDAGVDGVICVDIPPEEDDALGPALRAAGHRPDPPRHPHHRRRAAAGRARWRERASSITSRSRASPACSRPRRTRSTAAVARLKAATDLPVAVGFGVRTPEQAAAIARVADGVVVGSAIVELVGKHGEDAPAPVRAYIRSLSRRRSRPQGKTRMSWLTRVRNALPFVPKTRDARQSLAQVQGLRADGVHQGI